MRAKSGCCCCTPDDDHHIDGRFGSSSRPRPDDPRVAAMCEGLKMLIRSASPYGRHLPWALLDSDRFRTQHRVYCEAIAAGRAPDLTGGYRIGNRSRTVAGVRPSRMSVANPFASLV